MSPSRPCRKYLAAIRDSRRVRDAPAVLVKAANLLQQHAADVARRRRAVIVAHLGRDGRDYGRQRAAGIIDRREPSLDGVGTI